MRNLLEESDDVIGGFWGNIISFWDVDNWPEKLTDKTKLRIYGFKPIDQRLKVGNTIYCEMENSHMLFKILEIEFKHDPSDMFFGTVKPVAQVMKNL